MTLNGYSAGRVTVEPLEVRRHLTRGYSEEALPYVEAGELVRPPNENDPVWALGYDRDDLLITRAVSPEEAAALGIPSADQNVTLYTYFSRGNTEAVVIGKKRSKHKLMAVQSEDGTVTVFRDKRRNGVLDRKDLRVSNASVFIDVDKNGTVGTAEFSFASDSAGRVRFGNVPIRSDLLKLADA